MKIRFARWCLKHETVAKLLLTTPVVLIYSLLFFLLEASLATIIIIDIIVALLSFLSISSQKAVCLNAAVKRMNDECDPHALLDEIEFQRKYVKSKTYRQTLDIDYCTAISELGEYRRAVALSREINIDQLSGTLPVTKAIYYQNLAYYLIKCGEVDEAEIWLKKAKDIYSIIKNKKQKEAFEDAFRSTDAELEYTKGNYTRAAELLTVAKPKTRIQAVLSAFLWARVHIAMGQTSAARNDLDFVIRNGNKLACVLEATDIFNSLNA